MRVTRTRLKRFFLFLLLFCLFPLAAYAHSYYLKPEVTAESAELTLGSFLVDMDGLNKQVLNNPLPIKLKGPSVIAAAVFRRFLESAGEKGFILVGDFTVYIPASDLKAEQAQDDLKQLLRGLAQSKMAGEGWLEITESAGYRGEKPRYEVYRPVGVAARDLPSGEKLTSGAVMVEYRRSDERSQSGVILPENLTEGYKTRGFIRKGAPISSYNIERDYLLKAGEHVVVVYRKGSISLRLEAVAYESGARGDRVKVRPVRATKNMYGVVISSGEVLVESL